MQKYHSLPFIISIVLLLGLVLAACGGTPSYTQDQASTAAAATVAAMFPSATPAPLIVTATPETVVATATTALATTAPTSTPLPTTTALPQTRINFAQGATFGVVNGDLQPGASLVYVLEVAKGQPLLLNLSDLNNDMYFSVTGNNGTVLLPSTSKLSSWQTEVPTTQDYLIQVFAGAAKENFELSVEIPSRVSFASGAISASVTGSTVNGYAVSYVLTAAKNQTMSITLTVPANAAALTVYGYSDGEPYLRSVSGATTFSLKLPSTQDYIIKVVPNAAAVVNYSMKIIIK